MLRPDYQTPWLALIVLLLFGLFAYLVAKPLPRWLPQPPIATRPVVRFELPPVPAWPVLTPHAVRPGLSLAAVAG